MFKIGQKSVNLESVGAGKKVGIDTRSENGCFDPLPVTVENFMSVNIIVKVHLHKASCLVDNAN